MVNHVKILDTSLRDGAQGVRKKATVEENLEMAHMLEDLGVDVIEAGFPASSISDFESVKRIASEVRGSVICGLARATKGDIDRTITAVQNAQRPRIHTFIATSEIHMRDKLHMKESEVLERAIAAVRHARNKCDDVQFSLEDFTRSDEDFACLVTEAVITAGAATVNFPDTVGYATPREYSAQIHAVRERVPNIDKAVIAMHTHNDLGNASANVCAVLEDATQGNSEGLIWQVESTIGGIGERAGNVSLSTIVGALVARPDIYNIDLNIDMQKLWRTSHRFAEIMGVKVSENAPVVGSNAFSHEAGIHQDGMLANRRTYEILVPAQFGWRGAGIVFGKHSGRAGLSHYLGQLGVCAQDQKSLEKIYEEAMLLIDQNGSINDKELIALVS